VNKLLKTSLGGLLLALSLISTSVFSASPPSNSLGSCLSYGPALSNVTPDECLASRTGGSPQSWHQKIGDIWYFWSGYDYNNGTYSITGTVACPDAGTVKEGYQYPAPSSGVSYVDIDGCSYTMSDITICYIWEGDLLCSGDVTSTGNDSPPDTPPVSQVSAPTNPVVDDTDSTSETEVSPPVVSTLPDSTVVTTEEKTVTNTDKAGTIVDNGDSTITITDSDGTVSTYSENKVTTVHPDGTITEQITKDTTVSTPDKQKDTINKSDGTVINNITNGDTINHNEVVINNYDADGKLVSTGKVSTGSGESGDEGDSEKEGNCGAPGQPSCEVTIKDTSSDYADQTAKLNQIASDEQALHDEQVEDLKDGENDYGASDIDNFSVDSWIDKYTPFPTSTTCTGDISTSIFGKPFVLSPCVKLQPLRDILAWVFFILTIFTVIRITLDRKII